MAAASFLAMVSRRCWAGLEFGSFLFSPARLFAVSAGNVSHRPSPRRGRSPLAVRCASILFLRPGAHLQGQGDAVGFLPIQWREVGGVAPLRK